MNDRPVRIQSADFSMEEEINILKNSSLKTGAVVTFLGVARDFSEGREIKSITFEQYGKMALKAMERLRENALKRFDVIDIRMVHRVTAISPGGQIILIAVSSEQTDQAFKASSWLLDARKKHVSS